MNLAMHCDTISDSYIIQSCDRIEAHMATRSSLLAVELLICFLSTLAMYSTVDESTNLRPPLLLAGSSDYFIAFIQHFGGTLVELRREMDPNVNANDSFHSLTSLLVSADPKLAVCVTKFLRLADFKRLCCTSCSIHHTLSRAAAAVVANKEDTDSDLAATVAWLADLEILYALGCSSETTTLVRKISEAILGAPARYRVAMYSPAEGPPGDGTIFPTMTEAFTEFNNSLVCTEDGCEMFSFRDAHEFDLEHQNLQSERDYYFVGGDGDEDNDEDEKLQRNELVRLGLDSDGSDEDAPESSSKRQRTNRNGCDSQFCADGTNCKIPTRRMYYVQTSQYCGACIDSDIYLFLRFCSEHRVGGDYRNNTCWDIQEAKYVNDEAKVNHPNKNLQLLPVLQQKKKEEAKEAKEWLQLKNDEFWVTIWKTDPLHSCELRLIGVGPRY